ncbi:Protein C25F9.2 protein, partial [Aphelenchoides avenae]
MSTDKEVTDYRVVALDFECDISLKTDDPKKNRHRPNYAVVMVKCTQCMDRTGKWSNLHCKDCEICGPVKYKTFSDWDDGDDAVQAMLSFLFKDLPAEYKTFCYAHNGAKYDVQFVIDGMCKRGGQLPSITSNGNKIMQVWCRRSKQNNEVIFRDSCLMFPMKLDEAPEAFQLGIEAKQFFPYRYNAPANYERPLKGLPPMDDYIPSAMSDEKRAKFAEWWSAENAKQLDFDLKAQLKEYCTND